MWTGIIKPILLLIAVSVVGTAYGTITEKEVMKAVKAGNIETVLQFLDEGNDIDGIYGREKATLLNYSIKTDSKVVFGRLIEMGADPDKLSNGKTPIMFAVQNSEPFMLRRLVKAGANLDERGKKNTTAVIYAAKMRKLDCVKLLVENGADVELKNDAGMTALDYANNSNFPNVAEYLVKIIEMRHYYNKLPYYFDGPHIAWINDSLIRMFYMVYDTIKKFPILMDDFFPVNSDTIVVAGFAGDTNHYTITRNLGTDPTYYENVSRVLALGDIHGNYDALVNYLINNKIIDNGLNWIWGDGHLVLLGDVFDRGNKVTESLWLIYQLDIKAREQGGRVHLLLGNHEVMIMTNDTRYMNKKYEVFSNYFMREYSLFFDISSELGHWLRDRNTIIKINDVIYSHAGISPKIYGLKLSLDTINELLRTFLHDTKFPEKGDVTEHIISTAGPLWYRGFVMEWDDNALISQQEVDAILSYYEADKLVVAHTENDNITPLYNNKVIAIDVPICNLNSVLEGLLTVNGKFSCVCGDGKIKELE